jgi:hypothetical protein
MQLYWSLFLHMGDKPERGWASHPPLESRGFLALTGNDSSLQGCAQDQYTR